MKLEDLVGRTIIVKGFEFRPSSFHENQSYLRITASVDGKDVYINTSAVAVRRRLAELDKIFSEGKAVRVKVVKRKNDRGVYYFDFDAPG